MPGPVYQSSFSGREKGWVLPAGSQPETIKWLYSKGTFQDGRCQYDQGSSATRGLDVLPRSQGCISDSPNCQRTL